MSAGRIIGADIGRLPTLSETILELNQLFYIK